MTNRQQVYKCALCGNIVEVFHSAGGELVCCGQPMNLVIENTVDAAKEKHVPVIEKKDDGITVKVGAVAHPMEEKHYIEWIEVIDGDKLTVHYLKPGESPESFFCCITDKVTVRAYCNLHGLWKA